MSKLFSSHPLLLDKHLATLLGLNEALILQQIHYWLETNRKNNRNYHKNRYWTYNTIQEWQQEFPFWSMATVKRTFKKLREANLIITDNFNTYQMDRTLWYTINYEALERLMKECEINPNNIAIGSDSIEGDSKNDIMEEGKLTPPLPESTTENSSDIYNPSVPQTKGGSVREQRQSDRPMPSSDEFETRYTRIIKHCELPSIDEKYRGAVAHAIKLLLLDIEKSKRIKIGDNYIPVQMVEKDMAKLDYFVIEHAVNKFKEASTKIEIRNTIAYLKTCIYNAISEVKIELDSRLRYSGMI